MSREDILLEAEIPMEQWSDCYTTEEGYIFVPAYDDVGNMIKDGYTVYTEWLEKKNESKPPMTELELLKAQIQALSDENEFLSDCLIEMAQVVYA